MMVEVRLQGSSELGEGAGRFRGSWRSSWASWRGKWWTATVGRVLGVWQTVRHVDDGRGGYGSMSMDQQCLGGSTCRAEQEGRERGSGRARTRREASAFCGRAWCPGSASSPVMASICGADAGLSGSCRAGFGRGKAQA